MADREEEAASDGSGSPSAPPLPTLTESIDISFQRWGGGGASPTKSVDALLPARSASSFGLGGSVLIRPWPVPPQPAAGEAAGSPRDARVDIDGAEGGPAAAAAAGQRFRTPTAQPGSEGPTACPELSRSPSPVKPPTEPLLPPRPSDSLPEMGSQAQLFPEASRCGYDAGERAGRIPTVTAYVTCAAAGAGSEKTLKPSR